MNHAIAKVCAAINADDAGVHLDADEMREVIAALDERERAIGRERTRADAAEADRGRIKIELGAIVIVVARRTDSPHAELSAGLAGNVIYRAAVR